ncbi:MAG: hypothetical protein K2L19_01570 [Eubacterium sp.]|nr:hypothetical protein [Eubacterium sp.]
MGNKITMMKETFTNDKTGENVEGITIIIDGVLKQVFDKIIQENKEKYSDYTTLLQDALMNGINDIITK